MATRAKAVYWDANLFHAVFGREEGRVEICEYIAKLGSQGRRIAELARELMWKYPLKPKDALHVASAVFQQVEILHSYDDDDLIPLNGKIGNPPLKICHPGDGDGFELPLV